MSQKTFVVMGATGHIGHVLAEKLLEKGHKVRALGRDAKKLSALKAKGAETLSPAFDDAKALAAAFKGADGAFTMIPPNYSVEDYPAYQDKSGEAIATAIRDSGVKTVVSLSSVGAGEPSGTGPITALHHQEKRLNQLSAVKVLHLRPTAFMENHFWSIPVIKSMGLSGSAAPGDYPLPTVATKDIAAKAAELLDKAAFKHQEVFEFSGPREYTNNEVTAAIGKAIGKPDLKYVQFSYDDVKKGMLQNGMPPKSVEMMLEMYKAGNEGKIHPTQEFTAEHRGKTTIEEFAKDFTAVYKQG